MSHFFVIPKPLCFPNTSWKFVGLLVKPPEVMSFKGWEKCPKLPLSKMRTQKLCVILKNIITKGMTYTQTETKSIRLFNAYERLNSPPPFTGHFLLVIRSRCLRFWV